MNKKRQGTAAIVKHEIDTGEAKSIKQEPKTPEAYHWWSVMWLQS